MEKVLNNEIILFGKLIRAYAIQRINNQNSLRLDLEVVDDNEPDKINKIFVYAISADRNMFKQAIGKEIGIDGHVITHMGTKIIADAIRVI